MTRGVARGLIVAVVATSLSGCAVNSVGLKMTFTEPENSDVDLHYTLPPVEPQNHMQAPVEKQLPDHPAPIVVKAPL